MASPEQLSEFTPTEHNDLAAGLLIVARLPVVKTLLSMADRIVDGHGGDDAINYHCHTEPSERVIHVRRNAHDNPCTNINTTVIASTICEDSVGRLQVVRFRSQPGADERLIGTYDSANPHRNSLLSVLIFNDLFHVLYVQHNRATNRAEPRRAAPR